MRRWSEVAERVAATTRTSEKTRLLANELRTHTPEELPVAAVFWTGRPFPEADGRSTGLGWAAISTAVGRLAGADRAALAAAYDRYSDLGRAVGDVLTTRPDQPDPADSPSLSEVAGAYAAIQRASGAAAKAGLFEELLHRCDPLTAQYVVKILTGELRIGLREGLLEAAVAQAFDRPLAAVKRAGMLEGNIGATAVLAREDRLGEATPRLFHPLKFMLASPAENAAEIVGRLGPTVWVEDKYDGIRGQLHRQGDEVRLYSRDLNEISDGYPEVVERCRDLLWDGILDGELLGWRDGAVLPFHALQTRLGRKKPDANILAQVPVIFVAWDLLMAAERGGELEPLLERPLIERRRRLESLGLRL
ncbi:MAG TPA: hypothetical protein VE817_05800, partial [Candidatus Acidoferrum sp.]|nr:hypothetical protein [Candidatus Acidoferrum sp.]